jgi:hypothetical protein
LLLQRGRGRLGRGDGPAVDTEVLQSEAHLLQPRASALEYGNRLADGPLNRSVDWKRVKAWRKGDPFAGDRGVEMLRVVESIGKAEGVPDQGPAITSIISAASATERVIGPGVKAGCEERWHVLWDPPLRWFEIDDPAEGRRNPDARSCIGTLGKNSEKASGCRRAAAAAATSVQRQIKRVPCCTEGEDIRDALVAELRCIGLPEGNRASLKLALDIDRAERRSEIEVTEWNRSEGVPHPLLAPEE